MGWNSLPHVRCGRSGGSISPSTVVEEATPAAAAAQDAAPVAAAAPVPTENEKTPRADLIDAWLRVFAAAPPGKLPAPDPLDFSMGVSRAQDDRGAAAPNCGQGGDGGVRKPEPRNPKPETLKLSAAPTACHTRASRFTSYPCQSVLLLLLLLLLHYSLAWR